MNVKTGVACASLHGRDIWESVRPLGATESESHSEKALAFRINFFKKKKKDKDKTRH